VAFQPKEKRPEPVLKSNPSRPMSPHRRPRSFSTLVSEWTTRAETGAPVMKAFISERYGPPETLRMAEVVKPVPVADEALVKVLAVSVNPADWRSMRAKPSFSRATLGLLRPKHNPRR
jgi:hypothetical protein